MSISKIYDNLHFISYFSRMKKVYLQSKAAKTAFVRFKMLVNLY